MKKLFRVEWKSFEWNCWFLWFETEDRSKAENFVKEQKILGNFDWRII